MTHSDEPLVLDLVFDVSGERADYTVSLTPASRGSFLLEAAARATGKQMDRLYVERTGVEVSENTALSELDLVRGDLLTTVARSATPDRAEVRLRIQSGPGSGKSLDLPLDTDLGRAELDHASVSSVHWRFGRGPSGTTIEDLNSSNGTLVNGRKIERPVSLRTGDRIEIGPFELEFLEGATAARRLTGGHLTRERGQIQFTRPARAAFRPPETSFDLPTPPTQPPRRRFPKEMAIIPVLFGGLLFFLGQGWFFALFMLMGPVMYGFSHFDDKRSGRQEFEKQQGEFLDEIRDVAVTVSDSHRQLVSYRRALTPSVDDIIGWAQSGSADLWTRRPVDSDFTLVAVADGDQPSELDIRVPDSGAPDLLRIASDLAAEHIIDASVPLQCDLHGSVVGVVRDGDDMARGIARAIVAQMVALRSPRDVRIAVIAPEEHDAWEWAKWLPHSRNRDGYAMLGLDRSGSKAVFLSLQALLDRRQEKKAESLGSTQDVTLPHTLVVFDPPAHLGEADVRNFIADSVDLGFSVVYLADTPEEIPDNRVMAVTPSPHHDGFVDIEFADGNRFNDLRPRTVGLDAAATFARNLAPLVDVTSISTSSEVPTSATLTDVVGADALTVKGIRESWLKAEKGVSGVLGATGDGAFEFDLADRGPHGLVAGTTGSGKTEFLASLVMGLAIRHSPTKLNFIFVDYKANEVFQALHRLPHSVGLVTNLDKRLVDRSLISLQAELARRTQLCLDQGFVDMSKLRAAKPELAEPYLYLVVDEFARLKKDSEEFLEGLVDVAVAGRAFGIHLILATQDPSGIVPKQIESNINVRCALRVASEEASSEMLGTDDAANIPEGLSGRTFVKVGASRRSITEVQASYVGAHSLGGVTEILEASQEFSFDASRDQLLNFSFEKGSAGSDGEILTNRIVEAWDSLGAPALSLPWTEPLGEVVPLADLLREQRAGSHPLQVPVALADLPSEQRQAAWTMDLLRAGNAAIYGTSGSGKTTLLRSIAVALCATNGPLTTTVFGLDFSAGGLDAIKHLPGGADVIPGRRTDLVESAIERLEREVADRRLLMNDRGAGSWVESKVELGDDFPPYWVFLVDGIAPLWSLLEELGLGSTVADRFAQLMAEARTVGIHFVLTADQANAVPHPVSGTIGLTIVQRMASTAQYEHLEVDNVPSDEFMPPGRAMIVGGPDVQCGVHCEAGDHTAAGQLAGLIELGGRLRARGDQDAPSPFAPLPDAISFDAVPSAVTLDEVPIGLTRTHDVLAIDFVAEPQLLVVGRSQSGRSSTLGALARQLRPVVEEMHLVACRSSSPLLGSDLFDRTEGRDCSDYLLELQDLAAKRTRERSHGTLAVLIDDADQLFGSYGDGDVINRILYDARDANMVFVASAQTFQVERNGADWTRSMVSDGHAMVLQPSPEDDAAFEIRFPMNSAAVFPPGRGYYLRRGSLKTVHILSQWEARRAEIK